MKKINILILIIISIYCANIYSQESDFATDTLNLGSFRLTIRLPSYMIKRSKIYTNTQEGITKIYPFLRDSSCIIIDDTMLKSYPHYFYHYPNANIVKKQCNENKMERYSWSHNNLFFKEDYYDSKENMYLNLSIIYLNVKEKNKLMFDSILNNVKIERIK